MKKVKHYLENLDISELNILLLACIYVGEYEKMGYFPTHTHNMI